MNLSNIEIIEFDELYKEVWIGENLKLVYK